MRMAERRWPGSGGLHVTLSWPAVLRGAATEGSAGIARHGAPYVRPGQECACRRQACGGLILALWCEEHGGIAPAMEWHARGGSAARRCTAAVQRPNVSARVLDWSDLTGASVCGDHLVTERREVLRQFANGIDANTRRVHRAFLASVRVLGEGVDITGERGVEAICFADTRGSQVEIVQNIRRALRSTATAPRRSPGSSCRCFWSRARTPPTWSPPQASALL